MVETIYTFVKRLVSLLYKLLMVFIFLALSFVLSFPRIVIFYINDCYYDDCPEHLVGMTTLERYTYLIRKMGTAVDAVLRPVIEQLQWELFKLQIRQLASRLLATP